MKEEEMQFGSKSDASGTDAQLTQQSTTAYHAIPALVADGRAVLLVSKQHVNKFSWSGG